MVPNPARDGNFGLADDDNEYTRREAFYSTGIALTETECRFWDPAIPALSAAAVALPGGVAVDLDPKPTIKIWNGNAYIVGWADSNLRYDPVDRVLYEWGWEAVPVVGAPALAGGGTLVAEARYIYRFSWLDLYTGEESGLSLPLEVTTTAANRTVNFAAGDFAAYAGARHFTDGANLSNQDVALVCYRTGADRETFHFLTLVRPDGTPAPPIGGGLGLALCTLTDDGLATDASIKADVKDYEDPVRLNFMEEFRTMWWGVSWQTNVSRLYFNDFRKENSFLERTGPRNYRELQLQEGEIPTAVARTDENVIVFTNVSAYELFVVPSSTGSLQINVKPLGWTVGCVGPLAWCYSDGYLYWLSDRGPYRRARGQRPEWIGKLMVPLFIDPETGLCTLSATVKAESEVFYDQDADVIRWIFACGGALTPNRHLIYWVNGASINGDPAYGWGFCSPQAQSFDRTNIYTGLVGGVPADPFDRKDRTVWSDTEGFLYEYEPDSTRGGLGAGWPVTGEVLAGSGVALIVTAGGLYVNGDDMEGLRLEVVHTDGTIDVRQVGTNTVVNIVPDVDFSQDPTGATWYVAGIPAFWKSWVDSMEQPSLHKTIKHLFIGYNQEFESGDQVIDVSVASSDGWPITATRVRTAALTAFRSKMLVSLTGRYFVYEFANSRPDEPFMISYIENDMEPLSEARL